MTVKPAKKAKKSPRQNYSAQCDAAFSKLIRLRGFCEADDGRPCAGYHQCAHGFSRRYRAVRWDERNAWCLCAGHHKYYTHRPLEWDMWLAQRWSEQGLTYGHMRTLALTKTPPDPRELLPVLKERLRSTT